MVKDIKVNNYVLKRSFSNAFFLILGAGLPFLKVNTLYKLFKGREQPAVRRSCL